MQFICYDPSKREEWDRFVHSNPNAGLGHLSSQFVLTEGNATNRSIMMYEDPAHLVGVLPLYESKSRLMRTVSMRKLSSPSAGPLFRPDIAPSQQDKLLDSLMSHVKALATKLRVDEISVTFPSVIGATLAIDHFRYLPLRKYGFVESNTLGTSLDLRRSEAELLASLGKTCRYEIRKAEKDGVQISSILTRDAWLECYPLNEQTFTGEDTTLQHSKRSMEIVWDEFISKGWAYAFIATHEGRPLSAVVIQILNNCAYYWIAYNARPILVPGANRYLLWCAILFAKKMGVSIFLMGSLYINVDPRMQNISDFKRGYGGVPYYVLGGSFTLKKRKSHFILVLSDIILPVWETGKSLRGRLKRKAPPSSANSLSAHTG